MSEVEEKTEKVLKSFQTYYYQIIYRCNYPAKFKFLYFNPLTTEFLPRDIPDIFMDMEVFITSKTNPGSIFITEFQAFEGASKPSQTILQPNPAFIIC